MPQKVDATSPVHQGKVVLSGVVDDLDFDDCRYFTFKVQPATNVLVVSDDMVDAEYIANAIAPDPRSLPTGTARPFRAEKIQTARFPDKADSLSKNYRVVFLNNVNGRQLSEQEWTRLSGFVLDGGGLVIGIGRRSDVRPERRDGYRGPIAGEILPATLDKTVTPKQSTTFGQAADYTHPLFNKYSKPLDEVLSQVHIYTYWSMTVPEGTSSRILLSYADKSPALIERVFKGARPGRVLLWTTPLSRRVDSSSPDAWNEFPTALGNSWSFWYLMNQTVSYLSGTAAEGLDFEAGSDVVLPIDPGRRLKNYIVQDPEKKSERLSPPSGAESLLISSPQQLGNWSVKASGTDGSADLAGFSVNPPIQETQFVPLETDDLNRLFKGKDRYALADDPSKLDKVVKGIRVGRELFPWIMMLILIIVTLEGLLANRFYRETGQPAPGEIEVVKRMGTASRRDSPR